MFDNDTAFFARLSGRASAVELAIAEIIRSMPDGRRDLVTRKLEEIKTDAEAQRQSEFGQGLIESIAAMLK
jgi:hypothetical protein